MNNKLGKQTIRFSSPPSIVATASVVSKKEGDGPLGNRFDLVVPDPLWDEKSWEAAESKFLKTAIQTAVEKSHIPLEQMESVLSGDLMNQCTATAFGVQDFSLPLLGVYGACSTMAESLLLNAVLIDGGFQQYGISAVSSHFCSAEKQFRTPLEYGGQRPPTAQWTVTGAAAAVVGKQDRPPFITHATLGKIVDKGIADANNMGAAMAPAFVDTLLQHFQDTGRSPDDYDLIVSGDLGEVGRVLAMDLCREKGVDISPCYQDCGCLIFDGNKQDTHAGGSGCACSGSVLSAYLLPEMQAGRIQNLLFVPTGALMSPTTCMQGQNILGISYAIAISSRLSEKMEKI